MDSISIRRMVEIVCGGYTGEHDIMSSKESLQNHLKVLETRHRELDKKIESSPGKINSFLRCSNENS